MSGRFSDLQIRPWQQADGPACQQLIVSVLKEYGLTPDLEGVDADMLNVDQHYRQAGGEFFVVYRGNELLGTAGFVGLDGRRCELRKMYLAPSARGLGLGRHLLQLIMTQAKAAGYLQMQLETASVLKEAIRLYEQNGFTPSCQALHTDRCDRVYQKSLN